MVIFSVQFDSADKLYHQSPRLFLSLHSAFYVDLKLSTLPDVVTEWLPATHRATYFIIHTQVKRASPFPNHPMSFLKFSQWANTEPIL